MAVRMVPQYTETEKPMANLANQSNMAAWQTGKDLAQSNLHMLQNKIACDIDFVIQSSDSTIFSIIPAHSFMLISKSPVFEAMLTTDFREKNTKNVEIEDIRPQDFNDLLVFIYTEKTPITENNVLQLRYAANKYMIESLATQCSTFLEKNINIQNVCVILENSLFYKDDVSAQRCLNYIADKATNVLQTEGFQELSNQSLKLILDMDSLNVKREDSVLEAAMKWAHKQIKSKVRLPTDDIIRETLGDCLYQIRFGDLDPATLTQTVGLSGVLNDREFRLFGIYCHDRSKQDVKVDLKKLGFNLQPRKNCNMFHNYGKKQDTSRRGANYNMGTKPQYYMAASTRKSTL